MIQFDEHIFQKGWFNHQLVLQAGKKSHSSPSFAKFHASIESRKIFNDVFRVFQWSDATSLDDPFVVFISVGSLESQALSL